MFSTILAGLLLSVSPGDTPIEPIDLATVTIATQLPEFDAMCDGVHEIRELAMGLGNPEFANILTEAAISWSLDILEDGIGENAAFTPEAEEYLEILLAACAVANP